MASIPSRTALLLSALVSAALLTLPAEAAPAAKKPTTTAKKKASTAASKRKNAAPAQVAGNANAPGMQAAAAAIAATQNADAAAKAAADATRKAGEPPRTVNDILNAAPPEAWREPAPDNLVWFEFKLATQAEPAQVLMELAPRFAPQHAANVRALVRGGYFDGLSVLRVQDNFVTQWGDAGEGAAARALPPSASAKLPAEFDASLAGLPITALAENDGWAPLSGYVDGFAVAADPAKTQAGRAWLAHCYGVVGAGRGNEIDSSNGSSLYAIIGQPARSLDLNITVVGRVLKGIEHLAALPRGGGNMGFYGAQELKTPLIRARLAADMPAGERPVVKVLRTDTAAWAELLHARRHRSGWFVNSPDRVDLCSANVPVRVTPPGG